jgi:DHA3 family macrolide efflux protein-like MFS transporter
MESPAPEPENWKRPFFTLWTGQAFSLLGSSLVQFALVWYLTRTTDSAIVLTTASLVGMLPGVVLAPFAGALVDRWNRKKVMIAADSLVALATLAIVVLLGLGALEIWHLYVVLFIRGLGGTFHWPAMQSSTSLMVPAKQLARVQGFNQALNGVLFIAAPPLGALLIELLDMYQVVAVDVVTALIAIATMLFVAIPQPARAQSGAVTPRALLADIGEGFRYVAGWRGVVLLISMALLINFLFAPAFTLLPLMVTRIFKGGAWHLGAINSAWAVGMTAGGLLLGAWGGFKSKMVTSLAGVVGMGLGALVLALAPENMYWLALAGMAWFGVWNPIANGPLHALLQEHIAPEKQGRVFALIGAGANAMNPLSMLVAGPLAELLGLRFWYMLAAGACIVTGTGARFQPDIMGIEKGPVQNFANPSGALPESNETAGETL